MQQRAIIIGAGIGGLAAALGLRRAGCAVQIYERVAEPREVGAGITLWANALRALDLLGVGDQIRALGVSEVEGGFWKADGTFLSGVSAAALRRIAPEPNTVLHRAELLAALLNEVGQVHFGASCVGISETAGGIVAHFADGSSAEGDILIGADGLRSVVRTQLHGAEPPRYAGYTAWRAVVPFPHDQLRPGETWGAGARFGRAPLRDGRVYWFATINAPEGERSPNGEKAELLRLFGHWHAPIPELIATADESAILRNDIYDRAPLARWGVGRVTLLGDAAHPMTPNLGQGACQALEDAVVLMQAVQAHGPTESALRAYEHARIKRTNAIVIRSRQVGVVGQWQAAPAVWLRTQLVRSMLPIVQQQQFGDLLAYRFDRFVI